MSFGKIRQRLWMAALTAAMTAAAVGCARKAETPVQTDKTAKSGAVSDAGASGADGAAGAAGASGTETTGVAGVAGVAGAAGAAGTETAGQTESVTTAPKPVGAEVNGDTVNIISGVVMDAGADMVTLTTGRYPEGITFSIENAAAGFAEEPSVSQELTIFYRGDIKDKKTEGVTAELFREKRNGDEEAQAAMATGKIISIGMSVITIETADGKNISFEQDPKPVNTTEGPVEGDRVTIIYSYQDEAREGAVMPELIRKAAP